MEIFDLNPATEYQISLRELVETDTDQYEIGDWRFESLTTSTFPEFRDPGWHAQERDHEINLFAVSCNRKDVSPAPVAHAWTQIQDKMQTLDTSNGPPITLHLGDQVYCDDAFVEAKAILDRPNARRSPKDWFAAQSEARERYAEVYRKAWGSSAPQELREVLSSTSNLMIWDDHDITDDWGGNIKHRLPGSVDEAVGSVARATYYDYQGQLKLFPRQSSPDHEGSIHDLGDVAIVMLDVRSGRTWGRSPVCRMLGDHQWHELLDFLGFDFSDGQPRLNDDDTKRDDSSYGGARRRPRVLVICSPVPFAFLSPLVSRILRPLVNDVGDQWTAKEHRTELIHLLNLLAQWKAHSGDRDVILLAGDAHVGLESDISVALEGRTDPVQIRQYITSPVAGTGAGRFMAQLLRGYNSPDEIFAPIKRIRSSLKKLRSRPAVADSLDGFEGIHRITDSITFRGGNLVTSCNALHLNIRTPRSGPASITVERHSAQ